MENERRPIDVLVIGRSCVDHISVVDRFPRENAKAALDFRIMEAGGQGGTAACCISRLGGRVAYVGRVGDDPEGRFCIQRLADFGVGTGHVQIVRGGKTPTAFIFVTRQTGRRTIIYEKSGLPRLAAADIPVELTSGAGVLLLDPETTYLCRMLKDRGAHPNPIVYDCERWRDGIEEMMALADYFMPSAEFLDAPELGFGDAPFVEKLRRLDDMTAGRLAVTRGERGAYFVAGGKIWHVAAPRVRVKDTTGAGDNFHAAFALAVSRGYDMESAVRFSAAAASLSCEGYGGRGALPSFQAAADLADRLEMKTV